MSKMFTIKASEAHGRRLDPSFYSPQYKQLDEALASCCYDCYEIRDLRIEVFQGVSRNLLENDRIRLLKVKNILPDGSIDFGDTEPISDVSVNKILKDGDIISPFIGAAIKGYKFGYFEDREGERWTFDNNTGVFRNNDERVLSRYLWSFFQLEITHRQLDRIIGGGGVPYLGAEYAKRLKVILPPLPEQRKIVAELDAAYAAKRAADERAAKLLASIDEMVLKELGIANLPNPDTSLSSRIFTVPAREVHNGRLDSIAYQSMRRQFYKNVCAGMYEILRLNEIVDVDRRQTDSLGGLTYVGLENINGEDGSYCPTSDKESISTAVLFQKDEILFPKLRPYLNKVWLADFDGAASTEFFPLIPNGVSPEYLITYLRLTQVAKVMTLLMTGNTLPRVQLEDVLSLPVPIPPRSVQDRIASTASSIRAEARKLKAGATAALDAVKRRIEVEIVGQ